MQFVFLGALAFALFALYDVLQIWWCKRTFFPLFAAAAALLAIATLGLAHRSVVQAGGFLHGAFIWILFAALCFAALVYALFFALKGARAYASEEKQLVESGLYALCRHPGVIFLTLLYFCLWRAFGRPMLPAFLLFSALDLLYAWFQDCCVFPRQFARYARYRRLTPFLLPTKASVRRCWETLF